MPNLSVIVPVYNCESYVNECIKSILTQNFSDFELIIVDDGSTDKSLEICQLFETDSRVRLLSKENQGVSIARNTGLNVANGEYVMFVDSDDMLAQGMFSSMMGQIYHSSADLCVCGIKNFYDGNNNNELWTYKTGIYGKKEYVNVLLHFYTNPFIGGPVAKIFSKRILATGITFEENESFAEDFVFNMKYLRNVESITVLENAFYLRRADNPTSLSKSKRLQIPLWERKKYVFEEWNKTLDYLSDSEIKDTVLIQKFAVKSMIDICCSDKENDLKTIKQFISLLLVQVDAVCSMSFINSYKMVRRLFCFSKYLCILCLKAAANPKLLNSKIFIKLNK